MSLRPTATHEHLAGALQRAENSARRRVTLRHPLRRMRVALTRAGRPREVMCTIFSAQRMRVVVPEIVGTQLYCDGYIEPSVSRVMLEILRPGMVVFDVGAQYGYHALVAGPLVARGGTVVAFEPARNAFRLLSANVAQIEQVIAENVAVGAGEGTASFRDYGERHSALNTTLPGPRVPRDEREGLRGREYPVRVTTIDQYVAATGLVPDFVKLDAEGAEHAIIRGMHAVLRDASPVLSLETGDYDGMDAPETATTIDLLESLGYQCVEYHGGL